MPRRYRYQVPARARTGHLYILGKTGVGKSTCIVDLLLQDIVNFRGCGVIDPHSDLVYSVLSLMQHRGLLADPRHSSRIVYVNPRDDHYAPAFNVLAVADTSDRRMIYHADPRDHRSLPPGLAGEPGRGQSAAVHRHHAVFAAGADQSAT